MKSKVILVILLFVAIILMTSPFWGFIPYVEERTEAAPCVDGEGDVNLEGIMCDKSYNVCYGSEEYCDILAICFIFSVIVGIILLVSFVFCNLPGGRE